MLRQHFGDLCVQLQLLPFPALHAPVRQQQTAHASLTRTVLLCTFGPLLLPSCHKDLRVRRQEQTANNQGAPLAPNSSFGTQIMWHVVRTLCTLLPFLVLSSRVRLSSEAPRPPAHPGQGCSIKLACKVIQIWIIYACLPPLRRGTLSVSFLYLERYVAQEGTQEIVTYALLK